MKLSYEDKLERYTLRKRGYSLYELARRYCVTKLTVDDMIRLMERYGVEIVKRRKNTYYPPKLKLEMIHKVLRDGQSQIQVSLDYALPNQGTILHSDQGWQYQHQSYHDFFGILKSEMFYGYEKTFKSIDKLEQTMTDYLFYDNNKRIKAKLKGLSPVQYRTKSFQSFIVQFFGTSTVKLRFFF